MTAGVSAVVPVKDLRETKSRLAPILDPGARAGLTLYMMGRVVAAVREAGIEDVCVVSPDAIVLDEAQRRGATPLVQESRGLNPALEEGRRRALDLGAQILLIFPADLPLLDPGDVRAVLQAADGPSVVISPDGVRSGTNTLLIRPPDALPFAFGPESFEAHLGAARKRGLD
nr:2-phospho-L-lactate guanylyltransferase [Rubrobacter sp.]